MKLTHKSSKPTKWEPGARIRSFDELRAIFRAWADLENENGMVMQRHGWPVVHIVERDGSISLLGPGVQWHPVHVAWLVNQSAMRIDRMIRSGGIRRAAVTEAYKEWLSEEYRRVFAPVALIGWPTPGLHEARP